MRFAQLTPGRVIDCGTATLSTDYTLTVSGPAEVAVTFARGIGHMGRSVVTTVAPATLVLDPGRPDTTWFPRTPPPTCSSWT